MARCVGGEQRRQEASEGGRIGTQAQHAASSRLHVVDRKREPFQVRRPTRSRDGAPPAPRWSPSPRADCVEGAPCRSDARARRSAGWRRPARCRSARRPAVRLPASTAATKRRSETRSNRFRLITIRVFPTNAWTRLPQRIPNQWRTHRHWTLCVVAGAFRSSRSLSGTEFEQCTLRVGQIVPSSNTTMETEIPAVLRAREAVEPERFTLPFRAACGCRR